MTVLEKLTKLAKEQEKEKAKIEGRLESLHEELGEMGYTSVDSAKGEVILLKKKLKRMQNTFSTKLSNLEKDYASEI